MSLRNSRLVRFTAAVAAAGLGLLLRVVLTSVAGEGLPTYITFFPFVMVSALLGGFWPGVVTTLTVGVLTCFFVLPPQPGFGIESVTDAIGLGLFLVLGTFMSLLAELYRRARLKAAAFDREQALRESRRQNEFLANILERSSQAYVVGCADGRAIILNQAFAEVTGYTAEELRAMDCRRLIAPECSEAQNRHLEELHRTGRPVRFETVFLRKDGSRAPVELLVHLLDDPEGEPGRYYSFITDITERKRAETAMRELMERAVQVQKAAEEAGVEVRRISEQRRLALEAADLGAWDYRFQTGEVFWDERCREMWGIPQAETITYEGALARMHPEDRSGTAAAVQEALAGKNGGAFDRDFRIVWPDGTIHWIAGHGHVYFEDEGAQRHPVRFIGTNYDITLRKRREEQLHRLNRTLKALTDSSRAMMHATSEAEYLKEVCRIVVEASGHAMAWIGYAQQDAGRTVRPVAWAGFEEGYLETLRITWADTERGRGPTGTAIRTGKPCACGNVMTDSRLAPWRDEACKRGFATSLAVPLIAEGKAFGAISIYSTQPEPFSEDETKLLAELANDASYCVAALRLRVDRARLFGELRRELAEREQAERRTELLASVASSLLSSESPQRVVESLCQKVLDFLDCQVFFNYLAEDATSIPAAPGSAASGGNGYSRMTVAGDSPTRGPAQGRLHLNAFAGIPAEEARKIEWLNYGEAVCGCAARDGCRIVAEEILTTPDPRTELVKSYGIQAYACHPLMSQDRLLGTLSFGTRTRSRFSEEDLALMKAVSDQVAIAMERQRVQTALRERAEDLKRSNRDLEQFAYVASHDLQEPLRAVGGYLRLLERNSAELLHGKARDYMAGALDGAVRMERLITDLLALSRVSTGGREFAPASLEVPLERALRNLQFNVLEANATITHDPLPTLRVDQTQITQLFQNLIGNALKFSKDAAPEIHVGARAEDHGWVISVRDNGIGIAPEYFERIFQVFQRLHTRRKYAGTGVGLAICRRIVERHGGRIWVESQPDEGATFLFSLPNLATEPPVGEPQTEQEKSLA